MKEERNRVVEGMEAWKEKERKVAELFSPDAIRSREFQKMKLDHLYDLRNSINGFINKEEKMMLRMLGSEIDRLEKRLYPNLFIRLIVKLDRFIGNLFNSNREIEKMKPYVPIVPERTPKELNKETAKEITREIAKEIKIERHLKPEHKPLLEKKRTNNHKDKGLSL